MGKAIEAKEAARLANLDILKLKRRGIAATTRSIKVKQVRLYTLSEDGGLSAYDAETGESIWSIRVGSPHLTYGTLGITDEYVSVINGNNLYRVIADERQLEISVAPGGRTLPLIEMDNTPIMGATNTAMYTAVPMFAKASTAIPSTKCFGSRVKRFLAVMPTLNLAVIQLRNASAGRLIRFLLCDAL